ncbi:hypothetical protein GCM10009804_14230 [Kribbella hippodromi]|uniref:Aspartyl protease n=1 Tax=Kribbella hippodromi TaxID=434347 RepID=A0ABN2CIN4_9ACTN
MQHLVRVPIRIGDREYRFLVDTGIGITVLSSSIAEHFTPTGETYTGRRMSGQEIEAPLVRLPRVALGDLTVAGHLAGVADLGDATGPHGFAGILGPAFFEGYTVTTDPDAMTLTVQARDSFVADGPEIPLDIRRESVSVDPFTQLVLPGGREITVEVDTGSDSLILDTAQAAPRVQFQEIIHDGLVGAAYLGRYRMTFDVSGSRLVLGARQSQAETEL